MSPVNEWHDAWDEIELPVTTRTNKPRSRGLTMVIDKGLGLKSILDLLSVSGNYIDFIKIGFGTSKLYSEEQLSNKIRIIRSNNVHVYPGGTFLEIAIIQNKLNYYLTRAKELGFSAIEISDGSVLISKDTRRHAITLARNMGFYVISEVGKKDPSLQMTANDMVKLINYDHEAGSNLVIVEARESGKGIGIYNKHGEIDRNIFDELVSEINEETNIMWEAPLKSQQQELILTFGPNVNIGNIAPSEVLSLESLRTGLRGDTLKKIVENGLIGNKV